MTTPSHLRDRVIAEMEKVAGASAEHVVNGVPTSLESYREQVGYMRGIREGALIVRSVYREMFDLRDTETTTARRGHYD